MFDRRAILKSMAAAPAVFVSAATACPIVSGEAVPSIAAPVTAGYPFKWRFSLDGSETFSEDFDSREAAEDAARSALSGFGYSHATLAECQVQDFDMSVDAQWLLEHLHGNNEDIIGDGDFISPSDEQAADLEVMVNAAIDAWVKKHGIDLRAWKFAATRNHEDVHAEREPSHD